MDASLAGGVSHTIFGSLLPNLKNIRVQNICLTLFEMEIPNLVRDASWDG